MKTLSVDVAVIGAGSAGMGAYRAAKAHTDSVLLIEAEHYGTTCARVGCMPSKLLIAAAEAHHAIQAASLFGVHATDVVVDGRAVMKRVRDERDRFVGFVVETVKAWPSNSRLMGFAKFLDDNTLQVGDVTVHAKRIVIATGSRPTVPSRWKEELGDLLVVNDDVFDWEGLPSSIGVIGAGVIGLELGQALARLGVRTTIFSKNHHVGPLTDPALREVATSALSNELDLVLGAEGLNVQFNNGLVTVLANVEGAETRWSFDRLLVAIGRTPNLDGLGLENTSLGLKRGEVPPFSAVTGQVLGSHIFIAGDATNDRTILHEASDLGRIAGDNAGRYPDVINRPRRAPLSVVFSDPQMALAGATHAELVESLTPFVVGTVSFADQGRARVMGKNQGALSLYVDPNTGVLLGAEMVGPSAEHIGHLLAWSVQRKDTVQTMLDSPFYHPVVEEGLRTALRAAQAQLKLPKPSLEFCLDCPTR